jgi:predicted nucleic acid-binding protein
VGVSFVVMADRGIREALALDCHFDTAGFVRLPTG